MDAIFRLTGAVRRDAAVEFWLGERTGVLGLAARSWFGRMRKCGRDVRELIHDGCPVACVGDAAFAYVNVFKAHASVGFFHGADLADPTGALEGGGRRMRHVKVTPNAEVDAAALGALIHAAYADIKERLEVERYIFGARTGGDR